VKIHDPGHDGKPEARASGSPIAGGVRAVKALEDPLLLRSGYAGRAPLVDDITVLVLKKR